jgi:hypothetical protein
VTDAKENITITMPLYRWLMLVGALANLPDQSWYDTLIDQVLNAVSP